MAKNGSNFKNRGNKCKECMKEKKKQYDKQYRKDNEEKIRQYKNEHKNEKIQYDRLRYIKNREQVKNGKYTTTNIEKKKQHIERNILRLRKE